MYKLVAIAGKLRGQEFELENGENSLGRDETCEVHIPVRGVSKKHLTITVTDDVAYLRDLGSANGTFVNGKQVKSKTIQDKDKIALPDVILQLVHVKEKKIIIKQAMSVDDDDKNFLTPPDMPQHLQGRIIHLFKYKFMPIIHGINQEYEWRVLLAIVLALFVVINVSLTIVPILQDSKKILLYEIKKRGAHYADEISRMNASALEKKRINQINTEFLESEDGVESYELFDLDGRIVRPMSKLNEYISDPFSVWVKDKLTAVKDDLPRTQTLPGGKIGIGKKIIAYNSKVGGYEPVGIIAITFTPRSLAAEAANSSKAYFESLVTSFVVSIIFFAIIYYLTARPIEELKFQAEEAMRGKRRNLEPTLLMEESLGLKDTINSILQRLREANNEVDDSELAEQEGDESYVNTLAEFLRGSGVPAMVLNSNKELQKVNLEAEDLTGIRESSSVGMSLLDCAREKGFAATIIELCDNSANNGGTCQDGGYELAGHDYSIHAVGLQDKAGFAKAFYITFIKDE